MTNVSFLTKARSAMAVALFVVGAHAVAQPFPTPSSTVCNPDGTVTFLYKNDNGYRALAFWFEHTNNDIPSSARLSDYVISIDELEEKTGIDFFCNLPDDIENQKESNVALSAWGRMKY